MTAEQREMLQRSVGIIEGIAYAVGKNKSEALWDAWEIIQNVLDDDENTTPCEEGVCESAECEENSEEPQLPEGILSLENTIKIQDECRILGAISCKKCPIRDDGCGKRLDKSVMYHLKRYAGLE